MDFKENREGEETSASFESSKDVKTHSDGELFIARDTSFELEEGDEEAYGVYLQNKNEKITLGIFWDTALAELFINCAKNSEQLKNLKKDIK